MSKELDDYTKDELLAVIKGLKSRKKFGLVWEEKPELVALMCAENLPVLFESEDKAMIHDTNSKTHLIIEGDNFHSLSVLNYTHVGQVDVIYIDPPYNTGSKDFIYNDSYVDKEDTYRHSKWLSFMEKRLRLAKNLLKPSGAIFISIDQNELANLKLLCDEILTGLTMSGLVSVAKGTTTGQDAKKFGSSIDYLLVYVGQEFELQALPLSEDDKKRFSMVDDRGAYSMLQWRKTGKGDRREDRPNLFYPCIAPDSSEVFPIGPTGYESRWRGAKETFSELEANDMVVWKQDKEGFRPYVKYYLEGRGKSPSTLWNDIEGNKRATIELKSIIGGGKFDNPKPTELIRRCIQIATGNKDALILDFFAGSGTTGHAVLQLNNEDGGNRTFILGTNNENGIAENITYERIKGVIEGYEGTPGIPANLRYYKTDFVSKEATDDQTRIKLVERSQQIIAVREATYDLVHQAEKFTVLRNAEKYSAIVYDQDAIPALLENLNTTDDQNQVNIYVFSLSNDNYEADFNGLSRPYELRPIPEGLLSAYRRIFDNRLKSVGE
jgi:adenine-specific DNA-methyltransferase